MSNRDIVRRLVALLNTLQELSGSRAVDIDGNTVPIGGLPGFDSLNGVEATVMVCEEFKFSFPKANIFVNEAGTRPLTVTQVAKCVATHIAK